MGCTICNNNNNNLVPGCGCPDPCEGTACGCQIKINTECVTNTVDLTCSGVDKGLTLDKTLEGIDEYLCDLLELIQNVSNGFTIQNVGDRVEVFKGISGTGVRQFRTLESTDTDTLTIVEDGDVIKLTVVETTQNPFTLSTSGCGVSLIEDSGANSATLKGLSSNYLTFTELQEGCLSINLPFNPETYQRNKLLKNPNQVTSIPGSASETSILGSYTGTNVFTPSEMVPNTSYDILIRGRFTKTAEPDATNNGVFRFRLSGVNIGTVTLNPLYPFSSAEIEGKFELAFLPSSSAMVTGRIKLINNTNRETREYPMSTFFTVGSLDLATNKTLNITYTPSDTPITTQINKIQINKVR